MCHVCRAGVRFASDMQVARAPCRPFAHECFRYRPQNIGYYLLECQGVPVAISVSGPKSYVSLAGRAWVVTCSGRCNEGVQETSQTHTHGRGPIHMAKQRCCDRSREEFGANDTRGARATCVSLAIRTPARRTSDTKRPKCLRLPCGMHVGAPNGTPDTPQPTGIEGSNACWHRRPNTVRTPYVSRCLGLARDAQTDILGGHFFKIRQSRFGV